MSERWDASRRAGYRDEFAGGGDEDAKRWVDYMARAAEVWAADYLGPEARVAAGIRRKDRGWDLVYRGWRLDVKWTPQEPGRRGWGSNPAYPGLRVPTWKPRRADLYLLVLGDLVERFRLYEWADGWATRSEVEAATILPGRPRATSGQAAPFYFVGFDFLAPLEALLDIPPAP